MDIVLQILGGGTIVALGVVALRYNFQLANFTGDVGVFEKYLGAGGTYTGFKLLALIAIIGGFLWMTGLLAPVANFLLSPLINAFRAGGTGSPQ